MKVAILAGGRGIRLHPETATMPKPMIRIGDRPILWHIMRSYSRHGFDEFVVALGYRGDVIKRYVMDYVESASDLSVDFRTGSVRPHRAPDLSWHVDLVETGLEADTGARVRRLAPFLGGDSFMLTYGDGVADLPIDELLAFHRHCGRVATVTTVHPPARFGHVELAGDTVLAFDEKPQASEGWINGGFFVCEPGVLDYVPEGAHVSFERDVLPKLAADGQLAAYRHEGFWQCMDTRRDRDQLEALWTSGRAPWSAPGRVD